MKAGLCIRKILMSAGFQINGQAIVIEIQQPGGNIVKFTPVRCFIMTKDHEREAIIAKVEVCPDPCTVVSIKIYRLLSLYPAHRAACEKQEEIYSHITARMLMLLAFTS